MRGFTFSAGLLLLVSLLSLHAGAAEVADASQKTSAGGPAAVVDESAHAADQPESAVPAKPTPDAPAPSQVMARPHTTLSEEDTAALERGQISTGRYVAGGIVGTAVVGFGVGQAIQGRYGRTGWIFTVTEAASLGLLIGGAAQSTFTCSGGGLFYPYDLNGRSTSCSSDIAPLFWVGLTAYVGFRIWEIVDLWVGPHRQNVAYRRARAKQEADESAWSPYIAPNPDSSWALGMQYRF